MEMTAPQHPPLKSVEVNRSLLMFIVISITLHTLLIVLLSKSTKDVAAPSTSNPEPIRARIVYPTLAEAIIDVVTGESAFDSAEVETADVIDNVMGEPLEETKGAPDNASQVNESEPSVQPTTASQTQEASATLNNASPSEHSTRSGSTRDMLNRHLGQLHYQQQNQTAREASQGYQQHKNSPDLNIPVYQEPSNEPVVKQKIVACDNTAVNILRMVSQIAGGTLRCREASDIDSFIDKRIKKEQ